MFAVYERTADPTLFVAVTLNGALVVDFGVPAMFPVTVFSVVPAGTTPEVTRYVGAGVPLAATVWV
jgi:hypothetical protein